MTGVAAAFRHRLMHGPVKQIGRIGGVWIVAFNARTFLHGITAVGLFESAVFRVVTGEAERRTFMEQQILLVGAVRSVAGQASLLFQGGVNDLFLELFPVVALIAQLAALGLEQVGGIGGMGIVALGAFPLLESAMDIGFIHANRLLGMALQAKRIAGFLEQQLGNDAMAEVAVMALAFPGHRMHTFFGKIGLGKFFVTIETRFFLKPPS